MTTRRWTDNGFDVLTGWDRPHQRFFLVITKVNSTYEEYDYPAFSNLDLPNPAMTERTIRMRLNSFGITAPPPLWVDLVNDMYDNRGHLDVTYDAPLKPIHTEQRDGRTDREAPHEETPAPGTTPVDFVAISRAVREIAQRIEAIQASGGTVSDEELVEYIQQVLGPRHRRGETL